MKTIFALLALAVSTTASSACYLVYSPSNELVWRGTAAPVRMDAVSLSHEVNRIVPKGHLVVSDDVASCYALDLTTSKAMPDDRIGEIKREGAKPVRR